MTKKYENFISISGDPTDVKSAYSEMINDIIYSTSKNFRSLRKAQYVGSAHFIDAEISGEEHARTMYLIQEISRTRHTTEPEGNTNYLCRLKQEFEENTSKIRECSKKLEEELIDKFEGTNDGKFCTLTLKPVHTLNAPLDPVFLGYSFMMYPSINSSLYSRTAKRK